MPEIIDKFFNLDAFRRTSATLLADTEANILDLKRHGGWTSSAVTEEYAEDLKFAENILHNKTNIQDLPYTPSQSAVLSTFVEVFESVTIEKKKDYFVPISFNNGANCTFNFSINK